MFTDEDQKAADKIHAIIAAERESGPQPLVFNKTTPWCAPATVSRYHDATMRFQILRDTVRYNTKVWVFSLPGDAQRHYASSLGEAKSMCQRHYDKLMASWQPGQDLRDVIDAQKSATA